MSKDILLNSKGEYGNNCLTRLTVEVDSFENKKRARLEDEEEERLKKDIEEFKARKRRRSIQPDTMVEIEDDPEQNPMAEGGRGPGVITPTGTMCNTVNEAKTEPDTRFDDDDENPAPEPEHKAAPEEDIMTMAEGGGACGACTRRQALSAIL